jgi:hypothetical protein
VRPARPFGWCDVVLAAATAILAYIAYFPIAIRIRSDYLGHADSVAEFLKTGTLFHPDFLLHLLAALLIRIGATDSALKATTIVGVAGYAAVSPILYFWFRYALRGLRIARARSLAFGTALLVPFLQPVAPHYMIGYLWPAPYHNPTYQVLKPLALGASLLVVAFLGNPKSTGPLRIAACAVMVVAGALAKPSYLICAIPAVIVCAGYAYLKRKPVAAAALAFGFLLPAIAILLWQHHRTYATPIPGYYADSIIWSPFGVVLAYTPHVFKGFALSVLFPAAVLAMFGRRAWRDIGMRFAIVLFAFGAAAAYLMAEKKYFLAGNFFWSGYITLFILVVFCASFLLRVTFVEPRQPGFWWRLAPCVAAAAVQIGSGLKMHMLYLGPHIPQM